MSHTTRLMTTIFFALVLAAGLAVFAAGWSPESAEAQPTTTAPPAPPVLTPEQELEMYRMKKWLEHAKPSDFGTPEGSPSYTSPQEAQKRQRIFTKAARSKLNPALGKHLVTKGGLAGVAAGVWVHNGLMLYSASQCGEVECAPELVLDARFRQAEELANGRGGSGGFAKWYDAEGKVVGAGVMTGLKYEYLAPYGCRVTYTWESTSSHPATRGRTGGLMHVGGTADTTSHCSLVSKHMSVDVEPKSYTVTRNGGGTCNSTGRLRTFTQNVNGTNQEWRPAGPEFPCNANYDWKNPVFDVGDITVDPPSAPPNPYPVDPQTSHDIYKYLEADPEACPPGAAKPAEVCPGWKAWLEEDFLAPESDAVREALWGAKVGEWTTPGGGQCYEFEDGAKLCDHPDGTTFVWIVEDYTAWMQDSGGGKEWLSSESGGRPPGPPDGGSSGGGEEPPDIYTMVTQAANGERVLSEQDLTQITEHVAGAEFDPTYQSQAGTRLEGLFWEGNPVHADTLLSSADFHYLYHVRRQREWPEGTTQQEYEQSIRDIVNDPDTGILVSWYRDQGWQLTFVRRSGSLQGSSGHEWVMVEYNLYYDNWTTAFQPLRGLAYLEEPDREDAKWLRRPN